MCYADSGIGLHSRGAYRIHAGLFRIPPFLLIGIVAGAVCLIVGAVCVGSVAETACDVRIVIDTAVAEERPPTPYLLTAVEVDVDDE